MKHQNGLRIYGIYRFNEYPEWRVAVTGFGENEYGEWVEGWAFDNDGDFDCAVGLRLPMDYEELGYVYSGGKTHNLKLSEF